MTHKKELLRLFVIATGLAFSVGVLSSLAATQTTIPTWLVFLIASMLTAFALILLACDIRSSLSFEDKMKGVLFIDPDKNEIFKVDNYKLSENLKKVMSAVCAESRSIYSEWETSPLVPKKEGKSPTTQNSENRSEEPSYYGIFRVSNEDFPLSIPSAAKLLNEAILFVLLEELSMHLSDYFNNSTSNEYIAEINREDIPGFLLQNRVLNLLTTPIEQRDIFFKAFPNTRERPEGELESLRGSDGSMYSRFYLQLPKHTHVRLCDSGAFRIETKRFELEIFGAYSGYSANISPIFVNQYLGRKWKDTEYRTIEVIVRGRIKPLSLISSKGWEHYRWLDSFRRRLRSNVDFDTFLEDIHWRKIEPVVYPLRSQLKAFIKYIGQIR